MVCFFGPDSNGALPDPPGHLDPVRVLRQEPPLALFSGFGCPPTPARREKRPCVATVGVQACQIVSPVSRSRAAMMVCRSQPTKQVTSSPPWVAVLNGQAGSVPLVAVSMAETPDSVAAGAVRPPCFSGEAAGYGCGRWAGVFTHVPTFSWPICW